MKSKNILFLILIVFFVLLFAQQTLADGDGPSRPLTAGEKAFLGEVFRTIEKSLPPAAAGWEQTRKPAYPKEVPDHVEKGAFRTVYRADWLDQSQKTQRQQKLQNYMTNNQPKKSDMEAMAKQMDMSIQEQEKIMEELLKASQRNDQAGVRKAQEKLNALQQRNQQSMNKAMAGQMQAVKESEMVDGCLQVEIVLNETTTGLKKASPLKIAGAPRAFKLDDGNSGGKDCPYGRSVVLLGAWDNGRPGSDYTYYRGNWRNGIPHPSIKNMLITVRASDKRALDYLRAVKWSALNDLIAQ
jgi:hypothetical protein